MTLIQQYLTKNDCYKAGVAMTPKGVMVHSTGAENPSLARYVPGNEIIGVNQNGNHWNQSNKEWAAKYDGKLLNKCVHALIGKAADGSVATVQTLPWEMEGWHCGGSGNHTHISFEICEDGLDDPHYFSAVYREAVELTAMLCMEYDLNPLADGVVLCHAEGHARGIASNHGDVLHWFPRHGKTMDDFRKDVIKEVESMTESKIRQVVRDELARIQAEQAAQPASPWAVDTQVITRAKEAGISDGTRPGSTMTREEGMAMILAAVGK